MGITSFGFDELKRDLGMVEHEIDEDALLLRLKYLGEELCNHARNVTPGHSTGGYEDRTGNLRSSIGYRIYKDGEPVTDGGFKSVSGGTEGEEAAKTGLDAYAMFYEIPVEGWTLVLVAGMNYAKAVEAKGYNVLHLTEIEMQDKIKELKKKLGL